MKEINGDNQQYQLTCACDVFHIRRKVLQHKYARI